MPARQGVIEPVERIGGEGRCGVKSSGENDSERQEQERERVGEGEERKRVGRGRMIRIEGDNDF